MILRNKYDWLAYFKRVRPLQCFEQMSSEEQLAHIAAHFTSPDRYPCKATLTKLSEQELDVMYCGEDGPVFDDGVRFTFTYKDDVEKLLAEFN